VKNQIRAMIKTTERELETYGFPIGKTTAEQVLLSLYFSPFISLPLFLSLYFSPFISLLLFLSLPLFLSIPLFLPPFVSLFI
jgi:hypothetical protein